MRDVIKMGGLEMTFLQTKEGTGGSLDLFTMTVQPGGTMPVAHHHLDWDETVFGLSGVVTFTLDGRDIDVRAGDDLFIQRGTVHAFRNDSQAPATVLGILTPGVLGSRYFHEMADLLGATPPDRDKMRALMLRYGLVPART